jgi:hypothetical protein
MSIYDAIAQGSNAGAGINAFAQNSYMVKQDQQARQDYENQNAFAKQRDDVAIKQDALKQAAQMYAVDPEAAYQFLDYTADQYGFQRGDRTQLEPILSGMARSGMMNQGQRPSTVEEWEYFNQLSEPEKEQFLLMKRAAPTVNLGGGGTGFASPLSGAVTEVIPPNVATGRDAGRAGAMQGAKEGATIEAIPARVETETAAKVGAIPQIAAAEREAKGQGDLGGALEKANQAVVTLTALRDHPGTGYLVGASSYAPVVAGTDAAGAKAYLDQVKGQAFLQAFETLKGGGQITQIEGEKATAAIGRLSEAQKESEFKSALNELIGIAMRAAERAKKQAGQASEAGIQPGAVEDGYVFNGGDPGDPANWKKK